MMGLYGALHTRSSCSRLWLVNVYATAAVKMDGNCLVFGIDLKLRIQANFIISNGAFEFKYIDLYATCT